MTRISTDKIPIAVAGILSLALLAYTIISSRLEADPVYFSDGWWMLKRILALDHGTIGWRDYFLLPHGDQFNVLILGLYLLDWSAFAGTQTSIQIFGFTASIASLVIYAMAVMSLRVSARYQAALIIFAATIVTSLVGFENWYLPFQTSTAAARFLMLLTLALTAYGFAARSAVLPYLGLIFAVLGMLSQGMFLPLIVIYPALALCYRRYRYLAASMILPLVFFAIMLPPGISLVRFAGTHAFNPYDISHVLEVIHGTFVFIGGPFTSDPAAAFHFGIVAAIGLAVVSGPAAWAIASRPESVGWTTGFFLTYGLVSVATAALASAVTILRVSLLGPTEPHYELLLGSRYFILGAGSWIAIAGLLPTSLPQFTLLRNRVTTAGAALLLVLALFNEYRSLGATDQHSFAQEFRRYHAALSAGVYDTSIIANAIRPAPFVDEVPTLNDDLRARGKNIFAAPVPEIDGAQLTILKQQPTTGVNGCHFYALAPFESRPGVVAFSEGVLALDQARVPADENAFDAARYVAKYPDLRTHPLWQHWITYGIFEGRTPPLKPGARSQALYEGYSPLLCADLSARYSK